MSRADYGKLQSLIDALTARVAELEKQLAQLQSQRPPLSLKDRKSA